MVAKDSEPVAGFAGLLTLQSVWEKAVYICSHVAWTVPIPALPLSPHRPTLRRIAEGLQILHTLKPTCSSQQPQYSLESPVGHYSRCAPRPAGQQASPSTAVPGCAYAADTNTRRVQLTICNLMLAAAIESLSHNTRSPMLPYIQRQDAHHTTKSTVGAFIAFCQSGMFATDRLDLLYVVQECD